MNLSKLTIPELNALTLRKFQELTNLVVEYEDRNYPLWLVTDQFTLCLNTIVQDGFEIHRQNEDEWIWIEEETSPLLKVVTDE